MASFSLPRMPDPKLIDPRMANDTAIDFDKQAYRRSDQDFAKRHNPLLNAEKLFEAQTLKDQTGDTEFMPQMQNEAMRAGIGQSLDSFGDAGNTLAPGSAGEASVARNLGMSIMGFQDRNRQNRMASLGMSEALFPRRTIGLSGSDMVGLLQQNKQTKNNWANANYNNQVQAVQHNEQLDAGNAAADGQKKSAMIGAGAAIAGAVLIAF